MKATKPTNPDDVAAELRARAEKARADSERSWISEYVAHGCRRRAKALDEAASLVESSQEARDPAESKSKAGNLDRAEVVQARLDCAVRLERYAACIDTNRPVTTKAVDRWTDDLREAAAALREPTPTEPAPAVREEARVDLAERLEQASQEVMEEAARKPVGNPDRQFLFGESSAFTQAAEALRSAPPEQEGE